MVKYSLKSRRKCQQEKSNSRRKICGVVDSDTNTYWEQLFDSVDDFRQNWQQCRLKTLKLEEENAELKKIVRLIENALITECEDGKRNSILLSGSSNSCDITDIIFSGSELSTVKSSQDGEEIAKTSDKGKRNRPITRQCHRGRVTARPQHSIMKVPSDECETRQTDGKTRSSKNCKNKTTTRPENAITKTSSYEIEIRQTDGKNCKNKTTAPPQHSIVKVSSDKGEMREIHRKDRSIF